MFSPPDILRKGLGAPQSPYLRPSLRVSCGYGGLLRFDPNRSHGHRLRGGLVPVSAVEHRSQVPAAPIAVNARWRGKQSLIEVSVTRVTLCTVSYIVLDGPICGTLPEWLFLQDFQPLPVTRPVYEKLSRHLAPQTRTPPSTWPKWSANKQRGSANRGCPPPRKPIIRMLTAL
jgi:hypothetical protein